MRGPWLQVGCGLDGVEGDCVVVVVVEGSSDMVDEQVRFNYYGSRMKAGVQDYAKL